MATINNVFRKGKGEIMEKMKTTRVLFILTGNEKLVLDAISQICFKGICSFTDASLKPETVFEVFNHNKSVVCRGVTEISEFKNSTVINVAVVESIYTLVPETNAINVKKGNIAQQFSAIANYHHCDIGDLKSDTSASLEPFKRSDCPYCRYMDDGFMDKDINLHRTLYKSENFFVMPTIGEFVKGYLLIIPFDHVMSNGELSLEKRLEFLQVLDDVEYMLNLTYGNFQFLVWENGSGNGGASKSKTSIVHSHTHVVASNLSANDIEAFAGFPLNVISYEDLPLYQKNSYLLVRDTNKTLWRINDNPKLYIPRQYVRQLLLYEDYTKLPDGIWDWRAYPFIDKIQETCSDIKSALATHWNELPEQIRNNTKDFMPH